MRSAFGSTRYLLKAYKHIASARRFGTRRIRSIAGGAATVLKGVHNAPDKASLLAGDLRCPSSTAAATALFRLFSHPPLPSDHRQPIAQHEILRARRLRLLFTALVYE